MLNKQMLCTFIPTMDPDKAKAFYQDVLGLKLISAHEFAMEFEVNKQLLRITTVPEFEPFPFTLCGWKVDDIVAEINELKAKKVDFEQYEALKQDDLGIWTTPDGAKIAWFKDTDGNLLSLAEYV